MGHTIQVPGQTVAWYQCATGRILKMLGQSPGSPQIPMNLFLYMEVNAMFIFYDGYDGLVINSSTCGKFQDAGAFKSSFFRVQSISLGTGWLWHQLLCKSVHGLLSTWASVD